jgi:hypothetical protein
MKARLYKIHRILSLIVFIPVILWSLSGILHPVMANWFRIQPAERFLKQAPFEADSSRLSPQDVCQLNQIDAFQNIKMVYVNQKEYYQVKTDNQLQYFDTHDATELIDGDKLYAQFLARYYVGDTVSPINNVEQITEYTGQYKVINRLLPVYKVSFEREDGMDVYVETSSSGLGTMNDKYRKSYLWLFSNFHNWDFLGKNVWVKSTAILLFSISVFITGILGLIIYWKNWKTFRLQKKKNPNLTLRKRHRKISLATSIFLLAFAFSGGFHTFMKYDSIRLNDYEPGISFSSQDFKVPLSAIMEQSGPISKMGIVNYQGNPFFRIQDTAKHSSPKYYSALNGQEIPGADRNYAIQRAAQILAADENDVLETEPIFKYNHENGFINKRLPVWKVTFKSNPDKSCYVETASGIPGAIVDASDQLEGASFSFLHKYHMLDFMGKGWRDLLLSLAAFSLVVISLTGFAIWMKVRKKQKTKSQVSS